MGMPLHVLANPMRLRIFVLALAPVSVGVTAACSHNAAAGGARQPLSAVSPGSGPMWTTRFRSVAPTHLNAGDSTRHSSYGTVEWTPGSARTLSNLHLKFAYSGPEQELSWAILYGTCGTASLPVIPLSNFPEMDLIAGGTAEVNATLTLEFPLSGNYHAEIYKDRIGGPEAVVACGDFKYTSG